jgi:hypothetical protein
MSGLVATASVLLVATLEIVSGAAANSMSQNLHSLLAVLSLVFLASVVLCSDWQSRSCLLFHSAAIECLNQMLMQG